MWCTGNLCAVVDTNRMQSWSSRIARRPALFLSEVAAGLDLVPTSDCKLAERAAQGGTLRPPNLRKGLSQDVIDRMSACWVRARPGTTADPVDVAALCNALSRRLPGVDEDVWVVPR